MKPIGRVKQMLAVVAVLTATLAGLVVLRQAALTVLRSSSGADPASTFHDAPTAPADLRAVLHWLPDQTSEGRPMEPDTRDAITDAYAQAWSALDRAGRGDRSSPLDTYLTGSALRLAQLETHDLPAPVSTHHVSHDLVLTFYSDDGSVAALRVPKMTVVRTVGTGRDRTRLSSTESMKVVIVLQDGNWRVQLLERIA